MSIMTGNFLGSVEYSWHVGLDPSKSKWRWFICQPLLLLTKDQILYLTPVVGLFSRMQN